MNILFVTADYVSPLSGGIARMTYLLASELLGRGNNCISAYLKKQDTSRSKDDVFIEEYLLNEATHNQQLQDIIQAHCIDFTIVQGVDALMNYELMLIRDVVNQQKRSVLVFFVFHQMPGYELCGVDSGYLLRKILSKDSVKYVKQLMIQIISQVSKRYASRQLYSKYNIPYANADKIVLLSNSYIADFNSLAGGENTSKYAAIPNMLTYSEEECGVSVLKSRDVLIVARMDEQAKRIKRALQIWGGLPQEMLDQGWRLIIVGDGDDLTYYKEYVKRHNIKNVSFEGKQNPLSYYQKASIFMMTSALEGWPMTLMEAMQNGCVPIVFDSFKAVYDIIENNQNGVIVPNDDKDTYLKDLVRMMSDDDYRKQLAKNAIKDCQRFSKDRIVDQWLELFNSCK